MEDEKTLKKLPKFDENPFVEKAIHEIHEHTVMKRQYISGNRSVLNHVVDENGEIVGQSAFVKLIEVDEDQFAKIYLSRVSAFWDLTKAGMRVFTYIVSKCLIPDKDIFYVSIEDAMNYTGYSGKKYIFSGLADLVNKGIIARSINPYKYFINPLVIFNGSRITFAETYIKNDSKKKKSKEIDKSQLSLFPKLEEKSGK